MDRHRRALLLRGLVKCGHCGVGVSCHKMRGRNGTFHRYYYCHNHDPLRAGGEDRRCPERNIRSDEIDTFVFEQVRETLLQPDVLLAGEHAVSSRREPADDELLGAQLAKLERKISATVAERRRLADLYQTDFIERDELLRRGKEIQDRKQTLEEQRATLIAQRKSLAHHNQTARKSLRLVVEHVRVQGWQVQIKLRIPLDEPPAPTRRRLSRKDRLGSLHADQGRELSAQGQTEGGRAGLYPARSAF